MKNMENLKNMDKKSPLMDITGAVDLHVHATPCLAPRIGDDLDIARDMALAGLGGVMIKSHYECTASRAYFADQAYPGFRVFGGLALNTFTGGFNPAAVEAALKLGAKEIWMPTFTARYFLQVNTHITIPPRALWTEAGQAEEGLTPLDENGRLLPEVHEILALIAEHEVILGSGHLCMDEIRVVVRAAREAGVEKILITHPFFPAPGADLPFMREMTGLGAVAEFNFNTVTPLRPFTTLEKVAEWIRALGTARCVLAGDTGQLHNPPPQVAMQLYAQGLLAQGIPEADIRAMMVDNPRALLDY